jgi:hypothetical protein
VYDGYDEKCNLVRAIPPREWCLATKILVLIRSRLPQEDLLPYEVE